MKKKIIFLGGSYFQVHAYHKAHSMGYETICIDYLKSSPGHNLAKYSFVEDSTNTKIVKKIAKKLNVSAIIPYASDPAAYCANYVGKILKLKHNNINSIKILSNKINFRKFQKKLNFNFPAFIKFTNEKKLNQFFNDNGCVVIKPVDSSGSKGVSIVKAKKKLMSAIRKALKFSKKQEIIVEEFINKDGYQIAGDAFIYNSKIVNLTLANEHFSKGNHPVPIGESFPYNDIFNIKHRLKEELQKLIVSLKFEFGPINLDIRIRNEKVYIMEIGPRSGGNLIPQAIQYHNNFDQIKNMINAYLKKKVDFRTSNKIKFCSTYIIHSQKNGILKKIYFSKEINKNIIKKIVWKNKGDKIYSFKNSGNTIGVCILKFKTMKEMLQKMERMHHFIKVKI